MRPARRPASNLIVRIATAAIGIPLVLLVNYWGGWPLAAIVGGVAAVGTWEVARMFREAGIRPLYVLNLPAGVILATLPVWISKPQPAWIGIIATLFAVTAAYNLLPSVYSATRPTWALSMMPALYVGLLLGHLHLLRHAHGGAWWVLVILVGTWAYDTGAYFAGSYLGKRAFMQHVSPSKTLEGLVGGLALSAVACLVAVPGIGIAIWQALSLGVGIGVIAQLGDLTESMLKRQTGVKDSGTIIPGHGGLLDRVDSLLFTGTLGYYSAALLGYVS